MLYVHYPAGSPKTLMAFWGCLTNAIRVSKLPATCLALRLRGPRKILIFGVPFRPQVFLAFPPPVLLLPVVWQISLPLHSTPYTLHHTLYTLYSTQKIVLKSDFSCTIQNISLPLQRNPCNRHCRHNKKAFIGACFGDLKTGNFLTPETREQ